MITRDDLLNKITELGTVADDAERRIKLTALSDDVKELYDSHDTLSANNAKLTSDNKTLQDYNMQLFLRVGNQQQKKEEEPQKQKTELSYENIFNEKGELK